MERSSSEQSRRRVATASCEVVLRSTAPVPRRNPRKNAFGPLRVFRRTDGKYIVYDSRLPVGARTVHVASSFDGAGDYAAAVTGIAEGEDGMGDDN
jgi:hypothetical protein